MPIKNNIAPPNIAKNQEGKKNENIMPAPIAINKRLQHVCLLKWRNIYFPFFLSMDTILYAKKGFKCIKSTQNPFYLISKNQFIKILYYILQQANSLFLI